jgi:hypothetical protein
MESSAIFIERVLTAIKSASEYKFEPTQCLGIRNFAGGKIHEAEPHDDEKLLVLVSLFA